MSSTDKDQTNKNKKSWWQKQWQNVLFFIILALFLIPQTRKPIQVTINRVFSFSPSTIAKDEQPQLSNYKWPLRDLLGKSANLNRSVSKPILINFWATWCPPCIAEMPSMQKLYDDYQNQVDFYFVSNESTSDIKKFTETNEYKLPIYQVLRPAPEPLKSSSLPTTYVIDKQGNIHIQKVGAADWNSNKVRELLNKLIEKN